MAAAKEHADELRAMLLIAYNPVLGGQSPAYFVVPRDSLSGKYIDELRSMQKLDPMYTSYDNVTDRLSRKLDAVVVGNRRSLGALVQQGEAVVESLELRHALISTTIAG